MSSRHGTPAPFDDRDNIVNFADVFQGEDLGVKNLAFEREDGNNKIKSEDGVIKDEEQIKLRATISNNLPFTIIIPRQQEIKETNNNIKRYNLRRSARGIR